MRWLVLALTACAATTRDSDLDRWPTVTQDKLIIVVDRVDTTTTRPLLSTEHDDIEVDRDRTRLGAAEIDLLSGECVWDDGPRTRPTNADVSGFTKGSDGSVLVEARPVDVPVFPLGRLVAIAPGKAVFASPLGAIVFDGASAEAPKRGAVPPQATTSWWHAKTPLVVGQTIRTPAGFAVRVEQDALEIEHARERRRVPITRTASLVHFEGTEFVSTGDALIDVAHDGDVLHEVAVANLLAWDAEPLGGVYLELRDGRVLHTALPFKISDAKPLGVRMELIAVRGRHFIFDTRDTLFIFDGRTWRWRSYRACMPR